MTAGLPSRRASHARSPCNEGKGRRPRRGLDPAMSSHDLVLRHSVRQLIWTGAILTAFLDESLNCAVHTLSRHMCFESLLASWLLTLGTVLNKSVCDSAAQKVACRPPARMEAQQHGMLSMLETEVNLLCDEERLLLRNAHTTTTTMVSHAYTTHIGRIDFETTALPMLELVAKVQDTTAEVWTAMYRRT